MLFRSLRRLRNTLKAISPIAIIKAATAATDSPAIWAGLILGRSSSAAGVVMEVGVVEVADVAVAGSEIESTKTEWLDEICICNVDLVTDVMVALGVEVVGNVEEREAVLEILLGTTVRAVLVGKTAFF